MCTKRCACPSVVRPIIITRCVFPAAATTDDWTMGHNDRLEPWKLQSLLSFFFHFFIFLIFHYDCHSKVSSALGLVWQCTLSTYPNPCSPQRCFCLETSWHTFANAPATSILPISSWPSPAKLWHFESDLGAVLFYDLFLPWIEDVWMQHISRLCFFRRW